MSTLHKVKAYFGMAPMEEYDDEYYDDRAPSRGYSRPRFDDDYGRYEGRDYEDPRDPRDPAATRAAICVATCAPSRPTIRRLAAIASGTPTNRDSRPASSTAPTWHGRASAHGCAIPLAARWRWTRAGWR
ncbi:hypothetical protein NIIDMKKI_28360 [Mycobacterium kansasii]|uniref:Cell division protein SepF n=1 Tax=Mycobacterium kansasii TaxID=1768 RepID=A0A7G1I9N5_MYCKA|nr:hypothetical protein NIIDMKKI_28360 [Mycobacterium kansasii]